MTQLAMSAHFVSFVAGGRALIDDINLGFAFGQCVAIIGPNGAGKTTLLRTLSGSLRPHSGYVSLARQDVAAMAPRKLADRRAILSQNFSVAFPFRVREIVRLGAGHHSGRLVDELVSEKLADVDMSHFADRTITSLSGGEQQRVHLARVLVQLALGEREHGPGILMLDEPTASLDLRHQIAVLSIARRRAAHGTAVIAVLHDLNLAAAFADRLVVLAKGRVEANAPPADAMTSALLRRIYQVDIPVGHSPPNRPFIVPPDFD